MQNAIVAVLQTKIQTIGQNRFGFDAFINGKAVRCQTTARFPAAGFDPESVLTGERLLLHEGDVGEFGTSNILWVDNIGRETGSIELAKTIRP